MNTNEKYSQAQLCQLYPQFGKHCFVARIPSLPDKVLRIFSAYLLENWDDIESLTWGTPPGSPGPNMGVPLIEGTKIQNFMWLEGLAPRVYDIVRVRVGRNRYWGQICDDVGSKYTQKRAYILEPYRKAVELGKKKYGFEIDKEDVSSADVLNGKLVDFNTFHFSKDHAEKIKEIYRVQGKYGKIYYQHVKELGLESGPRYSTDRIGYMKLDKIDFNNKSFVDLGCAGGYFSRYAKDKGAKKIVGIDWDGNIPGSDPAYVAQVMAIELGYFDLEFYNYDLRTLDMPEILKGKLEEKSQYDIVFFLSLAYHIGIPKWLPDITGELLVFEDNSKQKDADVTLKKMFKSVELVGHAEDQGKCHKPIYHCRHK